MRILIFGTVFADTEEKWNLARLWSGFHDELNPDCDLLLIDSASPHKLDEYFSPVIQLGDNIGHLSRGGHDGWGRAFCMGLRYAVDRDYDYVAHIEGDSLCALDVAKVCGTMLSHDLHAVGVPVRGTKHEERGWVETGLIFFDVPYLYDENIVEKYNWRDDTYKQYPQTPEFWLRHILGNQLRMQSNWRTIRDDRHTLTVDNVCDYQWITHSTPKIYDAFASKVLVNA